MEENQDNVCKNCKFFVEYYIKCRSRFKTLSFGHCINKNSRKIIYDSDTCEKFQKRDYESDKKLIEKKDWRDCTRYFWFNSDKKRRVKNSNSKLVLDK